MEYRQDAGQYDLVYLDHEKCVGCNRCIGVCPVRLTNRADQDDKGNSIINLRAEYCIDCGQCIRHCTRKARDFKDDTGEFLRDLRANKRLSIVFAPALKTNYPHYKNLLGYLKQFNVNQIYDTSFGAEITTWAYLKFIGQSGEQGWISQPCPVVVNLIEKYYPELLPKLIPVHSPAMCTVMYMRKYMGITDDIAFLSPCIGKKAEFRRYGEVRYNVTYTRLFESLEDSYMSGAEAEPDSPPGELGSFYPSPGGLRENVSFHTKNTAWVRQIEGTETLPRYFAQYGKRVRSTEAIPLLVDVLNCARGCNDGTGTNKVIKSDDVEFLVHNLHDSAYKNRALKRKKYAHFQVFDKKLRLEDFMCSYKQESLDIRMPSQAAIENAFKRLLKDTQEEREINCHSCGYERCSEMAEMIARGINNEQNCIHYVQKRVLHDKTELEDIQKERIQSYEVLTDGVKGIAELLEALKQGSQKQQSAVTSILGEMGNITGDTTTLNGLIEQIGLDMKRYLVLTNDIVSVSEQTNILSLNASVESARAGQHGKGFAVVAGEVRSLAQKAGQSAKASTEINDSVQPLLEQMNAISNSFRQLVEKLDKAVHDISGEIDAGVQRAEEISRLSKAIVEKQ
ncbi:MAG: methyl-accepting chemotaxis protein [Oscillospiraceae bacterium]|jgi:iron only hydrogenase large subunit-like protein|nr:methyl-accepting chemotaxis protein [Oscillospiraceae bacterium]